MKLFSRIAAALSLAALFATSAVFAQAPTMGKTTAVKGYTKTLKSGKKVTVKGYARKGKSTMAPKTTKVKGYTKTLKSGKKVTVKGYTRKAPMKGMKMAPKKTM